MRYTSIMGLLLFLIIQSPFADSIASKIDMAVNKELPNAIVSILVKDAKSGQLLFSRNANKLLSPASNMKLFTAAAALYYWEPAHYFETKLLQSKQNYYIYFGGSPSLTTGNLSTLISYFKKNNIAKINGNIVLDTTIFTPPYYPNGVSYDDMGWYYAAPTTAIVLNENAVPFYLTTSKTLGQRATIKPLKKDRKLNLINEVLTVSKEEKALHCNLHVEIKPNNTLRLYGCAAQSKNSQLLNLAVPDPNLLAKEVIKETLQQNNIEFRGQVILGATPEDAKTVGALRSEPLTKLITHMLQESDNLYADILTKQLAYSITKQGTNKQAIFALKDVLSHNTLLDMRQLELADGIGTRYNLATAEQISILLHEIYHNKKLFPVFFSALPRSGVSGTLKDRMKKTSLEKIVYAKTGSMHDISSLSGYLINPNGKPLIFSIIINGLNKPASKAKALEEQILTLIDQEINGDSADHSAFA